MAEAGSNIVMSSNMNALGDGDIEAGNSNEHASYIGRYILPIEAPTKLEEGRNNDGNVVPIDKWVSSLESILEDVPHYMCTPGHPARISRIPENLLEVDRKSYEPCYLFFGPYHHGKKSLECMERRKLVVLKCFLEQRPELTLKALLSEIKSIEPKARSFYTNVEMESKKFIQMLLLDSLYLVVVFSGMPRSQASAQTYTKYWSSMDNKDEKDVVNQSNEGIGFDGCEDTEVMKKMDQSGYKTSVENVVHGPAWFWTLLVHGLFLLENQLPFFVLQKIHDFVYGGSGKQLIVAIMNMFQDLQLDHLNLDSQKLISSTEEIHHILHLCHLFFRPTIRQDNLTAGRFLESDQMFRLGSAVQLYEAGVSFEAKSIATKQSLLDITLSSDGKLVMPCLNVDDNTSSLLRNLIALEQMKYPCFELHVSAYAVLLLHLVTMPEDVKLLRKKGIIQHHLSSDKEMMHLINRLSVGLAFDYVEDKYSLKPVFHELKRFSDNRVPRWRAWLKHKYFNNPWTAISLMAASLLLLLSVVQTYYAVYSYYHPYFDGHT